MSLKPIEIQCVLVWYLCSIRLADAVQTVESAAGLAAWHHPWLHVAAGEVLQLVVDIQVPDAAVEAGRVDGLRGQTTTQRGGHHLLRHPCSHTQILSTPKTLKVVCLPPDVPLLLPPTYSGASPFTSWLCPRLSRVVGSPPSTERFNIRLKVTSSTV